TNSASSPKYSSGPISLSGRSPANSSSTRPDAITNMLRPNSPRRNTARPGPSSSRWPTPVNNAISRSDNRRGSRPITGVSGAAGPATFLFDRTLDTATPQVFRPDHNPAASSPQGDPSERLWHGFCLNPCSLTGDIHEDPLAAASRAGTALLRVRHEHSPGRRRQSTARRTVLAIPALHAGANEGIQRGRARNGGGGQDFDLHAAARGRNVGRLGKPQPERARAEHRTDHRAVEVRQ